MGQLEDNACVAQVMWISINSEKLRRWTPERRGEMPGHVRSANHLGSSGRYSQGHV